ncbi:MAG: sulfurtransferase TusA family protein [Pleomorphochaeta sp.]
MEIKTLDARGQSCPIPVVLTKKAIDSKPQELKVIVDNVAAKENVSRFANAMGYSIEINDMDNEEFILNLKLK